MIIRLTPRSCSNHILVDQAMIVMNKINRGLNQQLPIIILQINRRIGVCGGGRSLAIMLACTYVNVVVSTCYCYWHVARISSELNQNEIKIVFTDIRAHSPVRCVTTTNDAMCIVNMPTGHATCRPHNSCKLIEDGFLVPNKPIICKVYQRQLSSSELQYRCCIKF